TRTTTTASCPRCPAKRSSCRSPTANAPWSRNRKETTMKCYCVVNFREPLQEMDQPTPTPQGTQVLLKVRAAGVCHSDIHLWEGGYDLGQGRTLSLKDRGVSLPLTMGHETVGAVVAAGPDAQ